MLEKNNNITWKEKLVEILLLTCLTFYFKWDSTRVLNGKRGDKTKKDHTWKVLRTFYLHSSYSNWKHLDIYVRVFIQRTHDKEKTPD